MVNEVVVAIIYYCVGGLGYLGIYWASIEGPIVKNPFRDEDNDLSEDGRGGSIGGAFAVSIMAAMAISLSVGYIQFYVLQIFALISSVILILWFDYIRSNVSESDSEFVKYENINGKIKAFEVLEGYNKKRKLMLNVALVLLTALMLSALLFFSDVGGYKTDVINADRQTREQNATQQIEYQKNSKLLEGKVITLDKSGIVFKSYVVGVSAPTGKYSFTVDRMEYVLLQIGSSCYFILEPNGDVSNFSANREEAEQYFKK